jgi:hypothetical protein
MEGHFLYFLSILGYKLYLPKLPFLAFGFTKETYGKDMEDGFFNMAQKYNFSYEDYEKVKIFIIISN